MRWTSGREEKLSDDVDAVNQAGELTYVLYVPQPGMVPAASGDALLYTSVNSGSSWSQRAIDYEWSGVASSADGTDLVATISGGTIEMSSSSGATWGERGDARDWNGVASSADGSKLVATVKTGHLFTSKGPLP